MMLSAEDYNRRFDFRIAPGELVQRPESSINIILSASLRASHTFRLYAALLENLGCDAAFLPFEAQAGEDDRLEELFTAYRGNPAFQTIMVSDPFKQRVRPYLDHLTERAVASGGVNMITKYPATGLTGDNLDGLAFAKGLATLDGVSLSGQSMLFFGCGGVSSAVSTLLATDLHRIGLIDPDPEKAARLKDALLPLNKNVEILPVALPRDLSGYRVLYNGTGLGKGVLAGQSPLNDTERAEASLSIDAIYTPPLTKFLEQGQAQGARVVNGLSHMLASTTLHCGIISGQTVEIETTAALYRNLNA